MARRDITGAVDFDHLERFADGDEKVVEEVLSLFRQQAGLWSALLESDAWRDAVHTMKGAALGVGAFDLGAACERAEEGGSVAIGAVRDALDRALMDVAAYEHERALRSLKG